MLDHIDLQNLDPRNLTPELWVQIKSEAIHRAHEERRRTISEIFGRLTFWRRKERPSTGRWASPGVLSAHRI